MKTLPCFLPMLLIVTFCLKIQAQKTYLLIPKKSGKLDKSLVASLPPALKAMAAFYGAMGGTDCQDLTCELTSALGLGKQGSDAQKQLILKYFPGDKAAKLILGQDCYLPPSSSASFSNFRILGFVVKGDSVLVNYQLAVFDHGKTNIINGPDIYIFRNQTYTNKKRVLYAWTSK